EPAPNGGFVNLGAYGNTAEATQSAPEYVAVLAPDGGETLPADQTVIIKWRTDNLGSGTVDITLVGDASIDIVLGTENDGEYAWDVNVPSGDYSIRVTRTDNALFDDSDLSFSVVAPINVYYVNDAAVEAGDWTTAVGAPENDGLSPASPLDAISSVLNNYVLKAGDRILVDAGSYIISSTIAITEADAGVTVEGYHNDAFPARAALLDRANTGQDVFAISAESTLSYLQITGGRDGVSIANATDVSIENSNIYSNARDGIRVSVSTGVSVTNTRLAENSEDGLYALNGDEIRIEDSQVFSNNRYGIQFDTNSDNGSVLNTTIDGDRDQIYGVYALGDDIAIRDSRLYDQTSVGIYVNGDRVEVRGNTVFGNSNYGLDISGSANGLIIGNNIFGNRGDGIRLSNGPSTVSDNIVHENESRGIFVSGADILVTGNTVYGHLNSAGILLSSSASAEGNTVYRNATGIEATRFSEVSIRNNLLYGNAGSGIYTSGGEVTGNTSYGNNIGIRTLTGDTFDGRIANNVVYDNTSAGIQINVARVGGTVENNTVVQPLGDALRVQTDSQDLRVRNNILVVETGFAISIADDSQGGFDSDSNLLHTPGSGQIGSWNGIDIATLLDWLYEVGFDGNSLLEDPLLVDPDGSDDTRGYDASEVGLAQILAPAVTGSWTLLNNGGRDGDYYRAEAGVGESVATWTMSGLTPGSVYEVSVTWFPVASTGLARHQVFEGGELVTFREFFQSSSPNDFDADGSAWERIAYVVPSGDTLTLRLDNDANGRVYADALRIQQIAGDFGADDNLHLAAASPGIDTADIFADFANEPRPNGERLNMGAFGNTAEANSGDSPERIQLLSPNGLEKFPAGAEIDILWRTSGIGLDVADANYASAITLDNPIGFWRLDDALATELSGTPRLVTGAFDEGRNPALDLEADAYLTIPDSDDLDLTRQITLSMWMQVDSYESTWTMLIGKTNSSRDRPFALWLNSAGYLQLETGDGSFSNFETLRTDNDSIETGVLYHVAGVIDRDAGTLAIYINGEQVAFETSSIISGDADVNTAPLRIGGTSSAQFDGLLDEVALFGRAVSAEEILQQRLNVPELAVTIELLDANSALVRTVADGALARGSLSWTVPSDVPLDAAYRLRITAAGVTDTSNADFVIANAGSNYYIATDGDNANSGKLPEAPMASLRGLLSAYDLAPGDTVFIAEGSYAVIQTIAVDDAGITLQGVGEVVLDANNPDRDVMHILAAGVSLDNLRIINGRDGVMVAANDATLANLQLENHARYGVFVEDASGASIHDSSILLSGNDGIRGANADSILVDNNSINGSQNYGVYLESDSADASVTGNNFCGLSDRQAGGIFSLGPGALLQANRAFGHSSTVVYVQGNGARVLDNITYGNGRYGINMASGTDILLSGNTVFANSGGGLSVNATGIVRNNAVYDNLSTGINASGALVISGNIVHGHRGFTGILIGSNVQAIGNRVYDNSTGVQVNSFGSATIRDNIVYGNAGRGLLVTGDSEVTGNTSYGNNYGIRTRDDYGFEGLIANNMVYDNSSGALVLSRTDTGATVRNNTLSQTGGDALRVQDSSDNLLIRNNIFVVDGGHAISVANDSQAGFDSDYNLFDIRGNGVIGSWNTAEIARLVDWIHEIGIDAHSQVADSAFVNSAGVDGIAGFAGPVSFEETRQPSSLIGNWTDGSSTDPDAVAIWTLDGLTPGARYALAPSWGGTFSNSSEV
ncbi:MAG: parallel beta-helix repeat protein, partial [Rhodothermales bacterium]